MKTGRLTAMILVGLCVLLAGVGTAAAQDEGGLDTALRGLKWNTAKPGVVDFFRKSFEADFKEESDKVRDPLVKERLRQQMQSDFKRVEDSYKRLSGAGRTGFEVSVIAGEFEKNNGESLMFARDDFSQKYYLFADNKFWKLVIAYNTEYIRDIGFEAFVEQVSRKYGEPDETQYNDDTDELARAIWRDETTELRIENKMEFFSTFTMVFSDRKTAERLAHVRKAFGSKDESKRTVSRAIADIQEDDSFGVDEDIVDSLVGSRTEVDIESGMREDRELKRVGFEEQAADANADLADEDVKKRKKPTRRTGAKKPAKPAKSKDLIIY